MHKFLYIKENESNFEKNFNIKQQLSNTVVGTAK